MKVVEEKEACGELGCKGGDQVEEVKGKVGSREGSQERKGCGCEDKEGDSKDNEKDEEEDDQVLTFEEFKKKYLEQGGGGRGHMLRFALFFPPDEGPPLFKDHLCVNHRVVSQEGDYCTSNITLHVHGGCQCYR